MHLKVKPFFLPVSRKLVIEGLVLTESWIRDIVQDSLIHSEGPRHVMLGSQFFKLKVTSND